MLRKGCSISRTALVQRWSILFLLWTAGLLSEGVKCVRGLRVTPTGPRTVLKAEGDDVILGCSYTSLPSDTGDLDIEWSIVSPDTTQRDHMLISYTGGATYVYANDALARGLRFAAPDPSLGDASISIPLLSPAHAATYQCKVKKPPGVDSRKMSLVVMEKPSVPECWVDDGGVGGSVGGGGGAVGVAWGLVGGATTLRCRSTRGSAPLKYTWRRASARPLPAAATQDRVTGELHINNHSHGSAGLYLCEVNNAVGVERCRINLKANKPPNRAAVLVGTSVGSLLIIFILLVFITVLYWKLNNRYGFEKEFSNDIREDAAPPESRPVSWSRSSRQRPESTSCQLANHMQVEYNNGFAV